MIRNIFFLILVLLCCFNTAWSDISDTSVSVNSIDTVFLDLDSYINKAIESDPILIEKRFSKHLKELKIDEVRMGVILPKCDLTMGWGVTPGYKEHIEYGDTVEVLDFSQYGPAYVVNFKIAQPLNLAQRKWGIQAAEYDLKVKKEELEKIDIAKSVELQEYYYGYLLASEMHKVVKEAEKYYLKAMDQIEEMLDDDDESVSQFDFLELKAGLYEIEKNVLDAENGMFRVGLASKLALNLKDNQVFVPKDSALNETKISIPSLDSVRQLIVIHHPDLKRLNYGLKANENLLALANAQLGPQIVFLGEFSWGNSWVGPRLDAVAINFEQDPVSELSGVLGIGISYKLNIWNSYQKVRKSRAKYRELKLKENYAAKGLILKMEDAYAKMEMHKKRVKSAYNSLRATESWVKGAGMQYDLDKSKSKVLIKAFKANIFAKKNYYYAVYDYNISVAKLFESIGLKTTTDKL